LTAREELVSNNGLESQCCDKLPKCAPDAAAGGFCWRLFCQWTIRRKYNSQLIALKFALDFFARLSLYGQTDIQVSCPAFQITVIGELDSRKVVF
jgi:hypothetical protein